MAQNHRQRASEHRRKDGRKLRVRAPPGDTGRASHAAAHSTAPAPASPSVRPQGEVPHSSSAVQSSPAYVPPTTPTFTRPVAYTPGPSSTFVTNSTTVYSSSTVSAIKPEFTNPAGQTPVSSDPTAPNSKFPVAGIVAIAAVGAVLLFAFAAWVFKRRRNGGGRGLAASNPLPPARVDFNDHFEPMPSPRESEFKGLPLVSSSASDIHDAASGHGHSDSLHPPARMTLARTASWVSMKESAFESGNASGASTTELHEITPHLDEKPNTEPVLEVTPATVDSSGKSPRASPLPFPTASEGDHLGPSEEAAGTGSMERSESHASIPGSVAASGPMDRQLSAPLPDSNSEYQTPPETPPTKGGIARSRQQSIFSSTHGHQAPAFVVPRTHTPTSSIGSSAFGIGSGYRQGTGSLSSRGAPHLPHVRAGMEIVLPRPLASTAGSPFLDPSESDASSMFRRNTGYNQHGQLLSGGGGNGSLRNRAESQLSMRVSRADLWTDTLHGARHDSHYAPSPSPSPSHIPVAAPAASSLAPPETVECTSSTENLPSFPS